MLRTQNERPWSGKSFRISRQRLRKTTQGLGCEYRLIDLEKRQVGAEALPESLKEAEAKGFADLNITYPRKQAVLALLHDLSDDARAIGAVNTVVLSGGKRVGHNTDWWGFAESFRRELHDVQTNNVIQFGALAFVSPCGAPSSSTR